MKALVKAKAEAGLWLQDVPEPKPGPGEVLIKVLRTGICGTDLHIESWNEWAQSAIHPPLVVGHEFVGEVAGWGEGVEHLHEGELVGAEGHIVCGRCRNCMAGRRHLCPPTAGIGLEMSGQAPALREMIENMSHGGRIAILGLPDHEFAIDWSQVVFKMLTLKGVYGRQIFESWYEMSVFTQTGLDISPVVTHRFP